MKYFVVGTDSYSLYPLRFNTNPNARRFQKNKISPIFSELLDRSKGLTTFVNITNFYSPLCRRDNIRYFHYFEDQDSFNHDLAGSFSNCRGALDIMLGIAKYLGFSKAVLIGCDYLGTPPVMGHFYADKAPFVSNGKDELESYREQIKAAAEGIDVTVILPAGSHSNDFRYDSYENYFGLSREPKENTEFIDEKYLELLRYAASDTQAHM